MFFTLVCGQGNGGLIGGLGRILCHIFCNSLYGICIISSSNGLQNFMVKLSIFIIPFCACKKYEFSFCNRGKAAQNTFIFSTEFWYCIFLRHLSNLSSYYLFLIVYNLSLLKINICSLCSYVSMIILLKKSCIVILIYYLYVGGR